MISIEPDPKPMLTRADHLSEWRWQNLKLTVLVGPLVGGAALGVLLIGTSAHKFAPTLTIELGHVVLQFAGWLLAGVLLGWLPALICALFTNSLRSLKISLLTRWLIAPFIGAISVAISYHWLLFLLFGVGIPNLTTIALGCGAFSASVCNVIMEYWGRQIPDA